jgi:hypothetical protein
MKRLERAGPEPLYDGALGAHFQREQQEAQPGKGDDEQDATRVAVQPVRVTKQEERSEEQ